MPLNEHGTELVVTYERNGPTAVVLWMRDGSVQELPFATRFLAELYLSIVPFVVEPDGRHEAAEAMLSPLGKVVV